MAAARSWPRLTAGAVLAALAAVGAWSASKAAIVAYLQAKKPDLALQVNPASGEAQARHLATLWASTSGKRQLTGREREGLAASLGATPLNRVGLRLLGNDAAQSGDTSRARALMNLADRVSRRDLPTQVWLLQDAVRREDVNDVILHLDSALSTSRSARPQLYALLTRALLAPEVRVALAPVLKADREWGPPFIDFAIANTQQAAQVADLLRRAAPLPGGAAMRPPQGKLVAKLVGEGNVAAARTFAIDVLDAKPEILDAIEFKDATIDPDLAPLTWNLMPQDNIEVGLEEGNELRIRAISGSMGTAAMRVLHLPPGRYGLRHAVVMPELGSAPYAQWIVSCVRGSAVEQFAQADVGTQPSMHFEFVVPPGCAGTRFDLVVRAEEGQQDGEIGIGNAKLVRP